MRLLDSTLLNVIRQQPLVAATLLAVVLLSGVNWMLSPEQATRWLKTMLSLPLLSLAMTLWYLRTSRSRAAGIDDQQAIRRYFRAALTLVVVALGVRQIAMGVLEIWVHFGEHGADIEIERRILGLATSAVFLVIGNALPKILTPLAILPLQLAERVTAARRFIGMTWFALGIVMAVAFLFQPLELAKTLERWSILGGLLTMLGAIIRMNLGAGRHVQ
jgi:hypothetical protein